MASSTRQFLENRFPGLHNESYDITSEVDKTYNCIAWAAGDTARWWWPTHAYYWPAAASREETVDAFVQAFATMGYERCDAGFYEDGFEKVAIYTDATGTPTHAARQLALGSWTSKLGLADDIEHTLSGLEGSLYGSVAQIIRRRTRDPGTVSAFDDS